MLGSTMASAGDPAGAEPLLRQTIELQRKVLGPDNTDIINIEVGLAESLERQEKYDEAVAVYRHALDEATRIRGADHVLNTLPLVNLGRCLRKMKRFDEAEQALLRGLKLSEGPAAPSAKGAANFADQLRVLYEAWEKPEKAAEYRARADASRASTQPATTASANPATRPAN
jgi:serine/threonine-protein kinase